MPSFHKKLVAVMGSHRLALASQVRRIGVKGLPKIECDGFNHIYLSIDVARETSMVKLL